MSSETCRCGNPWCPGSAEPSATFARVEALALTNGMPSAYDELRESADE